MFQLKTLLLATSLFIVTSQATAEGEHSHDFPKEIMDFHHVMAPLWHMKASESRTKLSCKAADEMLTLTKAIAHSNDLQTTIKAMQKVCSSEKPNIQEAFKNIHDAFHAVTDSLKK